MWMDDSLKNGVHGNHDLVWEQNIHPRKISVNNYKTIYHQSLNDMIHPIYTHAKKNIRILILILQLYKSYIHNRFIYILLNITGEVFKSVLFSLRKAIL